MPSTFYESGSKLVGKIRNRLFVRKAVMSLIAIQLSSTLARAADVYKSISSILNSPSLSTMSCNVTSRVTATAIVRTIQEHSQNRTTYSRTIWNRWMNFTNATLHRTSQFAPFCDASRTVGRYALQ